MPFALEKQKSGGGEGTVDMDLLDRAIGHESHCVKMKGYKRHIWSVMNVT